MKRLNYLLYSLSLIIVCGCCNTPAQNAQSSLDVDADKKMIAAIFEEALTDQTAYNNLYRVCKETPGRLPGSEMAEKSVELVASLMEDMGLKVTKQPIMVPHWERGEKEIAHISSTKLGKKDLAVCALGTSIGTGKQGLSGKLVIASTKKEFDALTPQDVKGKIVFFNKSSDLQLAYKGGAYGSAVWQRVEGSSMAAKKGAIAVVIRSVSTETDDVPHTGVVRYEEGTPKIPAVAVSMEAADLMVSWLKQDPSATFFFRTTSKQFPDVESHNVIGELKGKSDNIILVGGHLDSWDLGDGAHDDAGGVIQSMEVLRILKKLNIPLNHTLRVVAYMNEEISGTGATVYAEEANKKGEKHIVAMESDAGVFNPVGFGFSTNNEEERSKIERFKEYFKPYGLYHFKKSGGGADVGKLRAYGTVTGNVEIDHTRYFDLHHSNNDVFEAVDFVEMQRGSAAMAAMIYLLDKYGL